MIRFPRVPLAFLLVLGVAAALTSAAPHGAWAETSAPSAAPVNLGQDVLALERLALRHPLDADVRTQLAARRSEAGLSASSPGLPARATGVLSLDAWALVGLAGLSIGAVVLLLYGLQPWLGRRGWRVREPRRRVLRAALGAAALLVVLSGASIALHLPDAMAAIVTDGPAPLRISPFAEAASRTALPVGARVHVERAFGDHVYVRDEQGREGWVGRRRLESILPDISQL